MKYCILSLLIIFALFTLIRLVKQEVNIYFKSGFKAVLLDILIFIIGIIIISFI